MQFNENYDSDSDNSDYYMQPDFTVFRQKDYYFLFDKKLNFSKRPGFCINNEIEVKDYLVMRKLNRKNLTKFLMRVQRNGHTLEVDHLNFDSQSTDLDYDSNDETEAAQSLTDEQLDE